MVTLILILSENKLLHKHQTFVIYRQTFKIFLKIYFMTDIFL